MISHFLYEVLLSRLNVLFLSVTFPITQQLQPKYLSGLPIYNCYSRLSLGNKVFPGMKAPRNHHKLKSRHTHIAIMRSSWMLTSKILANTKKIESRWYLHKYAPWGRIAAGDIIYFKDSG